MLLIWGLLLSTVFYGKQTILFSFNFYNLNNIIGRKKPLILSLQAVGTRGATLQHYQSTVLYYRFVSDKVFCPSLAFTIFLIQSHFHGSPTLPIISMGPTPSPSPIYHYCAPSSGKGFNSLICFIKYAFSSLNCSSSDLSV